MKKYEVKINFDGKVIHTFTVDAEYKEQAQEIAWEEYLSELYTTVEEVK